MDEIQNNLNSVHLNEDSFAEIICKNTTAVSKTFDVAVGHIEDIIIGSKFHDLLEEFLDKNCMLFEDDEENKLIYMDIFGEYVSIVEHFLECELKRRIPGFEMSAFINEVQLNKNDIEGEIFDILISFADFLTFKDLMLHHKAAKNGNLISLSICGRLSDGEGEGMI